MSRIPFNKADFTTAEYAYMNEAVARGHISGDGVFTRKCQALLEEESGARRALLTTSCTDALEMSAILLDIGPGDEVILPSFTFVSTANAFAVRGATPVFVDIRADTLNIDERLVERAITPRSKALVVVHYAGVGCEMDVLLDLAAQRGIPVIEDNAHGLFGRYKNRPLGSFGRLATQSFHETKNFTCGEGGALLINDPALAERAEIIREKGTNRSKFFRGQVDKYTWVDIGSSFLPSEILAALLFGQLERRAAIQARRRVIWERYDRDLAGWSDAHGVRRPFVPAHCDQAYHMYYLLMPSLAARQALIERLKARDIVSVFHYIPLHLSPMGRRYGGIEGQCPVTEDISDRLVRLPFFFSLTDADQGRVIEAVNGFAP